MAVYVEKVIPISAMESFMPIDLDMPAPLSDNVKITILRNAEAMMADGADAKEIVVAAVLDHFAEQKAFDVAQALSAAANLAVMLYGPSSPGMIAAIRAEAPEITSGMDDQVLNDTIVWDGDVPDWQSTATVLIRRSLKEPNALPMQRGKFLSKYGIVKADIEAITPAAAPRTEAEFTDVAFASAALVASLAAPEPVIPAAEAVFDLNAMLGIPTDVMSPMSFPAPAAPESGSASNASIEMTSSDIRAAFMLYSDALGESDAGTAQTLGISRQAFYNMRTGKTQKPKCDFDQAKKMLADIDVRVGKLMEAAKFFRAIRP